MLLRNHARVLPLVLGLALMSPFVSARRLSRQEQRPSPSPSVPAESPSPSPSPSSEPTPLPSPEPSPSAQPTPLPTPEPTPKPSRQIDKIALHQALLDLTSPWTVMCVAAHPDDEDGTTLTILRRKQGAHTVSLFSTFGEGGQNAVGPELYEQLGVIRARETLAASEIQGSEPYFIGLRDFGFSKSADETFRVWGKEEALRRMVLKIRELRPDVIITNHDTTRGHGHHQATGQLILEAFDAAADPKRFPEQLQQTRVWQPQRLFVRFRAAGTGNAQAQDPAKTERLITIDPNERDSVRGTIYAEQALTALQRHASQGPWPKTVAERLAAQDSKSLPLIRYALVREAPGAAPLTPDANNFLGGLTLDPATGAQLSPPTIEGRPLTDFVDMPDRVLNALIDWRRRRPSSDITAENSHRSQLINKRGNRVLALTAGITLGVISRSPVLVPGVLTSFTIDLANMGDRDVQVHRLSFDGSGTTAPLDAAELLIANTETSATVERVTPAQTAVTVPQADHLYDGRLFGERFVAGVDLETDGAKFSLDTEMRLDVVPAVQIKNILPSPCVRTDETVGHCKEFKVTLTNHLAIQFRGRLKIMVHGHQTREQSREIVLEPQETRHETAVAANSEAAPIGEFNQAGLVLVAINPQDSDVPITQRAVHVVYSAARVAKSLRVGYLPSFDQTLERSFAALGVKATQLDLEEIQTGALAGFDRIVIDNRGYQAHPELIAANARLLDYVRKGGTLIVFYHKDNEWNPDKKKNRPQLAPYSIVLGDDRVTEETAPVSFLQPGHPLMNFPNRIRLTDFDGWVQERGLYYPKEWDPRYQALLASADQGEVPLRGGLLVTRYGRGNYIYSSMVWYRQLAAGIPGAYRMFANMISYGQRRKNTASRR